MRIKKIDFYILTEVMGPFFGGVIFFIFIFLMFQALRLAEFFIVHGVAITTLLHLTSLMAVTFLPTVLPVAFLIAVLVGFGRLSADSELVALKANGVSSLRLSMPVVFFASLVVILSILLNNNWVPSVEKSFKTTLLRVSNTKAVTSIKEGVFTTGFFDLLIFADKVDTKTNKLTHVFIYDEREPKNPLVVVARSGEVVPVKTDSELGAAALLKLYQGSIHRNDLEGNTYQKIEFGDYKLYLSIEEGADITVIKPHMIPEDQLITDIKKTAPDTFEGREFRGEFWRRYATAITPLFFVFLGIGFGTVRTRSVRAGASLTAVLILIIYWVLQTTGTWALQRGILTPFIAMQLPNLVTAIGAWFSFRRALW